MSLPFHLEITDPRTNFWVSLAHTQHTRRVRLRHSPKSFPFPQRKKTKSIVMNPVGTLLWFQNKQTQQLRPTSVLQHHRPLQQRLRLIAGLLHHLWRSIGPLQHLWRSLSGRKWQFISQMHNMNCTAYSSARYRKWALLLAACHFLSSSTTSRNSKKYKIFAVDAADGNRRRQQTDQNQNKDPRDPSGYYQALNVEKTSDQKQIKSSYRKLALKYHVGKAINLLRWAVILVHLIISHACWNAFSSFS